MELPEHISKLLVPVHVHLLYIYVEVIYSNMKGTKHLPCRKTNSKKVVLLQKSKSTGLR